ncbi:MAG: type II toxin-antitoxin system YafQ family toxin [Fibromonadales bacterium]|nr:type II toxin-antitoxin system YafQ family toxin [Fibromonadales bacterium]
MLNIVRSSVFKTEIKTIKDESIFTELETVVTLLVQNSPLPEKYKLHPLKGNYKNYMECHLKPNILLVFKITEIELYLYRIGSHSKLFK